MLSKKAYVNNSTHLQTYMRMYVESSWQNLRSGKTSQNQQLCSPLTTTYEWQEHKNQDHIEETKRTAHCWYIDVQSPRLDTLCLHGRAMQIKMHYDDHKWKEAFVEFANVEIKLTQEINANDNSGWQSLASRKRHEWQSGTHGIVIRDNFVTPQIVIIMNLSYM